MIRLTLHYTNKILHYNTETVARQQTPSYVFQTPYLIWSPVDTKLASEQAAAAQRNMTATAINTDYNTVKAGKVGDSEHGTGSNWHIFSILLAMRCLSKELSPINKLNKMRYFYVKMCDFLFVCIRESWLHEIVRTGLPDLGSAKTALRQVLKGRDVQNYSVASNPLS